MIIREDTVMPPGEMIPAQPPTAAELSPDEITAKQEAQFLKQPVGKLRSDLKIFDGGADERGMPTKVIFDPTAGNYFRISEQDARIIACISGNINFGDLMLKVQANGIHVSTEKIKTLWFFLRQSSLLVPVYGMTDTNVNRAVQAKKKMAFQILLSSYLMFRIPLFSPDEFLVKTLDAVCFIFNRWTLLLLRLTAVLGYLCLLVNWNKFTEAFISSISFQGLAHYSIAVIIIKIIHEFAHAYTSRYYGCRVRKMGVAFIFFFPRLFSDLTDSWRVNDPWKRFMMDGAGIFSELIIGGLAALVWANTGSGLTHTVAYYIFAVSIINTVLINGNPFIRYDGYYMLMDALNIDNLQKRGVDAVHNIWRKHLFGLSVPDDPSTGWKRVALVIYGMGASVYRIFLYLSIILLVYFNFAKAIGIVCLVLEVYLLIWKPVYGEIKYLIMKRKEFNKTKATLSLSGIAVIILILVLPLPWNISAPCEIRSDDSLLIHVPVSGFAASMPPEDGAQVQAGQLLMTFESPFLRMQEKENVLDEKIDALSLDNARRTYDQQSDIKILEETLMRTKGRLVEVHRQQALLELRTPIDGKFILHDRHLEVGKWLSRGTAVGEVFTPSSRRGTAYVPEKDLKYLKVGDSAIILLNKDMEKYQGRIVSVNPQAANPKASPLLNIYGGPIIGYLDELNHFVPLSTYYELEIVFDEGAEPPAGRTGVARMVKYSSIAGNVGRLILRVLQTEVSF